MRNRKAGSFLESALPLLLVAILLAVSSSAARGQAGARNVLMDQDMVRASIDFLRSHGQQEVAGSIEDLLQSGAVRSHMEGTVEDYFETLTLPGGLQGTPSDRTMTILFCYYLSCQAPVARSAGAVSYAYGGHDPSWQDAMSRTVMAAQQILHFYDSALRGGQGEKIAGERLSFVDSLRRFTAAAAGNDGGELFLRQGDGPPVTLKELASPSCPFYGTGQAVEGLFSLKSRVPRRGDLRLTWKGRGIAATDALELTAENTSHRQVSIPLVPGMVLVPDDRSTQIMMIAEEREIVLEPGGRYQGVVKSYCLEYEKRVPPLDQVITYRFASKLGDYSPYIAILRAGLKLSGGGRYTAQGMDSEQYCKIVIQRSLWKENMKNSGKPHTFELVKEDIFDELSRIGGTLSSDHIGYYSGSIWRDILTTIDFAGKHGPLRPYFPVMEKD